MRSKILLYVFGLITTLIIVSLCFSSAVQVAYAEDATPSPDAVNPASDGGENTDINGQVTATPGPDNGTETANPGTDNAGADNTSNKIEEGNKKVIKPQKKKLTPQQKLNAGKWKIKKSHVYHFNSNKKKTRGFVTIKKKKYYFDKDGIQRTGWRKIKGKYYFFKIDNKDKGYMVTSKTVNDIRLNKIGEAKVSSPYAKRKLDLMVSVAKDVDKITNCKMTLVQKLRKAYDYEMSHYYIKGSPTFHYDQNWGLTYAARIYWDKHGACYEFGALYAYFANACGAKDARAVSSGGHGWAEVDGRVFDPNWQKGTGLNLFNMDYSLSGRGGIPGYARDRNYLKRV